MDTTRRPADVQRDKARPGAAPDAKHPPSKWLGSHDVVNQITACSTSSSSTQRRSMDHAIPDDEICWVCLDGATEDMPLMRPCRCPRYCHSACIARWQLQSAGSKKETHCEFCQQELPEWKDTLTPQCGSRAPAIMNVNFGGKTYSFEVQPGPQGYRAFTEAIRKAFGLPDDSELNITFTCDEPSSGQANNPGSLLTLQGAGAYDAAVHCASVSAARRICAGQPAVQGPLWSGPPLAPASPSGATTANPNGSGTRTREGGAGSSGPSTPIFRSGGSATSSASDASAASRGSAGASSSSGGSSVAGAGRPRTRMVQALARIKDSVVELFGTSSTH